MKLRSTKEINVLPREILVFIFACLDLKDVGSAAKVCKLWREVASTKSLWIKVQIDQFCEYYNQHRISPSWRSFVRRYIGSSLKDLSIDVVDNMLLRHLRKYCPNLDILSISKSCKHIDFNLIPSTLRYLDLAVCDVTFGVNYPTNWYMCFHPGNFPNLRVFKVSHATHFNEAMHYISTLALTGLYINWMEDEVTDKGFDELMTMGQLEYLELRYVTKLPTGFAHKILQNLKKLQWINFFDTDDLRFSDVRTLAQLPQLKEMLLPARKRAMKALIKSIPTMKNLKEVSFDDESNFMDPGPSNVLDMLTTLQELRPDVVFVFRGTLVCKECYDQITTFSCIGEFDDANETDDD